MRALSLDFFHQLEEGGKYGDLVKRVRRDKDLDLEFRGSYINVYYQGHSILLLRQNGAIEIDEAFTENGLKQLPKKISGINTYLDLLPYIKDNVSCHVREDDAGNIVSKRNRELEFEQLLIRANNRESRNNSEYIVIDRQYVANSEKKRDRWDLIALRYPSDKKPAKGYLSIIEVKYGSSLAMADIVKQVEGYGLYYESHKDSICSDMENIFKQKIRLGLITRTRERLDWLKELSLVGDIKSTEILVYLIDCNPGKIKERTKTAKSSFGGEVRVAFGGLALWRQNSVPLGQN